MGLAHSPRIVIDGLLLALDAGNTKSYPGGGTTWTDTVGDNNGTLTGPTFSSVNGGSIFFDGTNDYVTISDDSDFTFGTGDLTVEAWFRPDSSATITNYHTIISCGWPLQLYWHDTQFKFWASSDNSSGGYFINGSSFNSGSNSAVRDVWHHIVVTRSGSDFKMYLNGELVSSASSSSSFGDPNADTKIGQFGPSNSNFAHGRISNLKVYKGKGLTAAEVTQNYNALIGRYLDTSAQDPEIVQDGLILHLDAANNDSYSGSGNTWTDLSGEGNNATRTSSSEVVYNSNGWFDWTDGPASDSTQGCFTLPGNSFTLGANFTIEVWNYYDSPTAPSQNPWSGGNLWTNSADADWSSGAGNNNGFLFGYNSITFRNTSGSQINSNYSTNPSTQTWHQHVLVVNSGIATVYVDKVSVDTTSNFRTIGQSNGTLGIGIADRSGGNYRGEYLGFISNVKIYSQALSTSEIEQNYNALKGRYGY